MTTFTSGEKKMQAIFGNLNNYLSPSANFNHQITLETFSGIKTYQVISAFQYQDNTDEATVPKKLFYTTNFASTTECNTYIQQVLGLSAVNFNQTATFGDKFLTLYTCSLETEHRTMVIAKLVN